MDIQHVTILPLFAVLAFTCNTYHSSFSIHQQPWRRIARHTLHARQAMLILLSSNYRACSLASSVSWSDCWKWHIDYKCGSKIWLLKIDHLKSGASEISLSARRVTSFPGRRSQNLPIPLLILCRLQILLKQVVSHCSNAEMKSFLF
jgi:hypothetical protein